MKIALIVHMYIMYIYIYLFPVVLSSVLSHGFQICPVVCLPSQQLQVPVGLVFVVCTCTSDHTTLVTRASVQVKLSQWPSWRSWYTVHHESLREVFQVTTYPCMYGHNEGGLHVWAQCSWSEPSFLLGCAVMMTSVRWFRDPSLLFCPPNLSQSSNMHQTRTNSVCHYTSM